MDEFDLTITALMNVCTDMVSPSVRLCNIFKRPSHDVPEEA